MLELRRANGGPLTHDQLDNHVVVHVTGHVGHGFAVGSFVYRDSASTFAAALATAEATLADGMVVYVSGNDYSVVLIPHEIAWTHSLGGTPPELAYLSTSTPGAATLTLPTSGLVQPVGKTVSASLFLFKLGVVREGEP